MKLGLWRGVQGRAPTPRAAGSSKPLPLLAGCCRTTSWEGSLPRRCGSCRACSRCESQPCPCPPPSFLRPPFSSTVQTACHSWLRFLQGFVVIRMCVCTLACYPGSKALSRRGLWEWDLPRWGHQGSDPGVSGVVPRSLGWVCGDCRPQEVSGRAVSSMQAALAPRALGSKLKYPFP